MSIHPTLEANTSGHDGGVYSQLVCRLLNLFAADMRDTTQCRQDLGWDEAGSGETVRILFLCFRVLLFQIVHEAAFVILFKMQGDVAKFVAQGEPEAVYTVIPQSQGNHWPPICREHRCSVQERFSQVSQDNKMNPILGQKLLGKFRAFV